jgi:cytidyltransferase-like protein
LKNVVITGSFDNLGSRHVRLLEEASCLGRIRVLLWPDETVDLLTGRAPRFPEMERLYLLRSIRFAAEAEIGPEMKSAHVLPDVGPPANTIWVVPPEDDDPGKRAYCAGVGIEYRLIPEQALSGFPVPAIDRRTPSPGKKAIVTGCFDYFHSGHVRFFEEVSTYGELTVSVGSDANVQLLKGPGHPKFSQAERLYLVAAVKHVFRAVIGSGEGWMDAAPEIEALRPDYYIVNEDGDRPEKREYCEARDIKYLVLRRTPQSGLPRRDSTTLRGY